MSTWTTISDARIDADSPLDEDLMTDFRENDEYLYERHIRSGTATTGVRTIMARGKSAAQSLSLDAGGDGSDTVAITFSTDATDGNPAFSVAPVVVCSVENDGSDPTTWGSPESVSVWIHDSTLTTTGFTAKVAVLNSSTTSATISYVLHWIALGT